MYTYIFMYAYTCCSGCAICCDFMILCYRVVGTVVLALGMEMMKHFACSYGLLPLLQGAPAFGHGKQHSTKLQSRVHGAPIGNQ